MEECHVLLLHALRVLRRVVAGRARVDADGRASTTVAPGTAHVLSETLAAFAHPRFPFRAKTRRRALRVVAAAATAVRAACETDTVVSGVVSIVSNAVSNAAAALSETTWPALAALLEADHPARAAPGSRGPGASGTFPDSGCSRSVVEASARVVAACLRGGAWGWGRAEREILAPHGPGAFWRRASAPYRALALRVYARLGDASPVLGAGVGAPLLKLWTFATLDPAAGGDAGDGSTGGSRSGFAKARARLTAVRAHPRASAFAAA